MSQKTRFIIYGIVAVILTATYFIKESKTIIRLPVIGKIPAFSFIDSHGDEINRRNLDGKVWVADFIFTTCTMACPVMTGNMNIIHKEFRNNNNVRIASLNLKCSPCYDTDVIKSCPKNICMHDLDAEKVFSLIKSF